MTSDEIVKHVSKWFRPEMSPGQVFDDLVYVRKAGVTWEDVAAAVMEQGMVVPADVPPKSRPKSEHKPPKSAPEFRNPKPSFGPYLGKTLLDIIKINPGYVAEMAANDGDKFGIFWSRQAQLAQLAAQAEAPAYKDTDPGRFLQ